MRSFRCLLLLAFWSALATAQPTVPWHLAGWQARAVVEITQPTAGADTAAVKVLCQGTAKADGSDLRVLDAAGKPVPFQTTFHAADRYSLISFRADGVKPGDRFFVYFGNPGAARAAEQIVVDPAPGAGPPKAAWVPQQGLVLQTWQRPKGENPKTVEELKTLLAGSTVQYGARYQRAVADGYNPFGPSDHYLSIYRGWMLIPTAGKYSFCTASNEASFSFLDGKELVHWPGRHTAERGIRGEVHVEVELTAGPHYLEYYHEEVELEQMAFLGWKPPGAAAFQATPASLFPEPHATVVTRYESPGGPLPRFEPTVVGSIWPADRSTGQYTLCRFTAAKSGLPDGTKFAWDFGDGITAVGPEVEHVYLRLGNFSVTLTAETPGGTRTAKWPLEIFEIENVTAQFREGRPKDYAQIAGGYDRTTLDADSLRELAFLLAESEAPADALQAGTTFVQRFGTTAPPAVLAQVRRLMADCALRQGKSSVDEAIKNYQASLAGDLPPAERIDVLTRLIRLLGQERNEAERAEAILKQAEQTRKNSRPTEAVEKAFRRALIAAGDVRLWSGKRDEARELYARAERPPLGRFIPSQVRAAQIGAFPNAIREYIGSGSYGAALDLVDRWDDTFPTDKPNGHTFFWRGKLLLLRGQTQDAERFLARAVRHTVGASFETEARWLLAQALEQLGKPEDARRELQRLIATGIDDDYSKRAREKLK
jgi:tetratricopeptide (TPR) repeat protein